MLLIAPGGGERFHWLYCSKAFWRKKNAGLRFSFLRPRETKARPDSLVPLFNVLFNLGYDPRFLDAKIVGTGASPPPPAAVFSAKLPD